MLVYQEGNMEPENEALEEEIPCGSHHFQFPSEFSRGVSAGNKKVVGGFEEMRFV